MVGVDTQVVHGFLNCGASGAITGVGNALPMEVLRLIELCQAAQQGDGQARLLAEQLDASLAVLAKFDEGPDLVLFYKHLMVLEGHREYELHFNASDRLSDSQRRHIEAHWRQFRNWWSSWAGTTTCVGSES